MTRCEDKIALVAEWAKKHPGVDIGLQGHMDQRERVAGDQGLSERRALAVREALVQRGVEASRIKLGKGDGGRIPCSDSLDVCRERNQRVQVWFGDRPAPATASASASKS